MPRSSVSQRVRELVDNGLLTDLGEMESTGGRRAGRVGFPKDAGIVLAVELGSTHARWRLADFAATSLADGEFPVLIASGAEAVLGLVEASVYAALELLGVTMDAIRSCAIGFPAPVNFAEGRVTGPPNMAGWDHAPISELLSKWMSGPVVVDNDVNVMAWGEYDAKWRLENVHDMLFIKHGTGIGCGVVAGGKVYRGHDGTAGEVGHISVAHLEHTTMCSCGSSNCLEVVASGRALVNRLRAQGYPVETASDVARLVVQGDLAAMSMVREAGKALGAVMSGIISFFNPAVIVMGGSLGALEISLLAGMREATYAQATMFSTRNLRIEPSHMGPNAGLHGATLMALELAYDAAIDNIQDHGRMLLTEPGVGSST
jgi:predicted NBD/HSP70 family sugar kinase